MSRLVLADFVIWFTLTSSGSVLSTNFPNSFAVGKPKKGSSMQRFYFQVIPIPSYLVQDPLEPVERVVTVVGPFHVTSSGLLSLTACCCWCFC